MLFRVAETRSISSESDGGLRAEKAAGEIVLRPGQPGKLSLEPGTYQFFVTISDQQKCIHRPEIDVVFRGGKSDDEKITIPLLKEGDYTFRAPVQVKSEIVEIVLRPATVPGRFTLGPCWIQDREPAVKGRGLRRKLYFAVRDLLLILPSRTDKRSRLAEYLPRFFPLELSLSQIDRFISPGRLKQYPRASRLPAVRRGGGRLGKVAFFSAISGNYDPVREPSVVDPEVDYILYTDMNVSKSSVWQKRDFEYHDADPVRTARFVKLHPHLFLADYDAVIWVDSNLQIRCVPDDLMSRDLTRFDIVTWIHPLRDCIYEEAKECIIRKKDDEQVINAHVARFRKAGYPQNAGLIESSVVFMRHKRPHVVSFLNEWWAHLDNGSRRDQLSFNPALRNHPKVKVGYFGDHGVQMRNDLRFTYSRHGVADAS